MFKLFGLISITLVASLARSDCSTGTLKCNTTSDPHLAEICDNRNGWVLNAGSGACEEKSVEGCKLVAPDEASNPCFKCESGKVFDLVRTKCVDVAADLVKPNCAHYSAENSQCEECKEGFFLRIGECTAVTTKVANCMTYSSATDCFKCASRYRLDGNQCLAFTPVLACQFQTDRVCDKCEAGYQLASREPEQLLTTLDYLKGFLVADRNTNWWLPRQEPLAFCVEQQVKNCVTVKNAFECLVCEPGFFLNSSFKCVVNPYKSILKCAKYKDRDTCVKCESGFFLTGNPLSCKAATQIEKCVEYEPFSDQCKKCEAAYWWDAEKRKCVLRVDNTVVQCKNYSDYADECTSCNAGYSFSDDKKACFVNIENCLNQTQALLFGDVRHVCSQCMDNFVYLDHLCKKGNLDHCLVYKTGEMKCTKCKSTHYVKDDLCELRTTKNCKQFVGDTSNNCSVCESNFYENSGDCTLHSLPFCVEYIENKNECVTCTVGYYESTKTCLKQDISHCYEYTKNKNECEQCSLGYFMDAKACPAVNKANCHTYTVNTNVCEQCSLGYYLNGTDCVDQDVTHCIKYTVGTNDCLKCQAGKYMSAANTCSDQTGNFCIGWVANSNTCNKCQAGYWLDASTCVQQNVANCLKHEDNKGTCETCATGYYLSTPITCTKLNIPGCVDYNTTTGACTQCSADKYLAFGSCITKNVVNCIEYTPNSNVCSKCAAGYYLNSADNICQRFSELNCIEFETTGVCKTCAAGFKLTGANKCKLVFQDRCIEYNTDESCKTCEANTYLKGGDCLRYNVPNCLVFDTTNGECQTCAINYYLETKACHLKSVEGCLEYETANSKDCATCAGNRLKISGQECKKLDFTNCMDVNGVGDCNSCGKGYWLDGTTCKPQFVKNCVKYDAGTTDCAECAAGYHKKSTSECEWREQANCVEFDAATNKCSKCMVGYVLTADAAKNCIEQKIADCIDYETGKNECKQCMAGYYLESVIKCSVLSQANCIKFTGNPPVCNKCAAPYILKDGTVAGSKECDKPETAKCIKYDANRVCTGCSDGTYLNDSKQCIVQNFEPNCIDYNEDECTKCAYFYYLNDQKKCVVQNIPNCIEYNQNVNTCKKCEKPRYLKSNTECAMPYVEHCISYTHHTNNCLVCAKGTFWNGSACTKVENPFCIRYAENTENCYKCQVGYYKTTDGGGKDVCVESSASKCITFTSANNNTCAECEGDYRLTNAKACVLRRGLGNCLEYNSDSDECQRCADSYYVNGSDTCTSKYDNDCIEFANNSSKRCSVSVKNKFFTYDSGSDANTYQTYSFQAHCLSLNGGADSCSRCVNGYVFGAGADAANCVVADDANLVAECHDYDGTTGTCSNCRSGWYWDLDAEADTPVPGCKEQSLADCDVYLNNQNKCFKCNEITQLTDPTTDECTGAKGVGGCAQLTWAADEAKCTRCTNKKYLKSSTQCDNIDEPSTCALSNGYSNYCQICQGLDNLGKGCSEKKQYIAYDSQCRQAPNGSNSNRPGCSQCASGYGVVRNTHFAQAEANLSQANCTEVDHVKGNCIQCKPFFTLTEDSTCRSFYHYVGMGCAQWDARVSAIPSDNVKCFRCSSVTTLYLEGGVCKSRHHYINFPHCKEFHADKIGCKECNDDHVAVAEIGYEECVEPGTVTVIEGCKQYKDLNKCRYCDWNYKLVSETSCVKQDPSVIAFSSKKFNNRFGSMENFFNAGEAVTNCEIYSQIYENSVGCTRCKTGYVGIVSDPNVEVTNDYAYALSEKNSVGFDDVVNTFKHCREADKQYKKGDGNNGTSNDSCLIGFLPNNDSASDGYACLLCKPGYLGRLGKLEQKVDGSPIAGGAVDAVVDCSNADVTMTMVNSGMFFSDTVNEGKWLVKSSYMGYDTCPSGKRLVYSFITSLGYPTLEFPQAKETGGDGLKVAYCLDEAKVPETKGCQVYALNKDFVDPAKLTNADVLINTICAMCKPGHLRSDDNECVDLTYKCTDPVPVRHFLGGCRKMATFNLAIFGTDQLQFSEASSEISRIEACLIHEVNSSACIICQHGFTLNDGSCVLVSNYQIFTARWGISKEMPSWWDSPPKAKRVFSSIVWRFYDVRVVKTNNVDHFSKSFLACAGGKVLNYKSTEQFNKCHPKTTHSASGSHAGCKKHMVDDLTKCVVCDDATHLQKPSTYECIAKTGFTGCLHASADGNSCIKCQTGFGIQTNSKVCVASGCLVADPSDVTACLVCPENRKMSTTNANICLDAAADGAETCSHWSATLLGRCVKCKTAGHYPYNLLKRESSADVYEFVRYECKDFSKLARNTFGGGSFDIQESELEYNFEYIYVDTLMTMDTGTVYSQEEYVRTASALKRYVSMNWYGTEAFCHGAVAVGTHPNCATPGIMACVKCNPTTVLQANGTCSPEGSTTLCSHGTTKAGSLFCLACDTDHYKSSDSICEIRVKSHSDICTTIDPDITQDKCIKCNLSTKWIDANGECKDYVDAVNCQTWEPLKDECKTCPFGKWWNNATPACEDRTPKSVPNCVEADPKNNLKCMTCTKQTYLDVSGTCVEITSFPRCKEFNLENTECTACTRLMKFNGDKTNCVLKTATNCLKFTDNAEEDKCETCFGGYYLVGDNCEWRNGTFCKTYANDPSDVATRSYCASCGSFYNFSNAAKTCAKKTAKFCATFSDTEDKCATCERDFYFFNGECLPKPITNCRDFSSSRDIADQEKCSSCREIFVFGDDKCKMITKTGCNGNVSYQNKCASCSTAMMLDDDGETCVLKDAQMCLNINTSSGTKTHNNCSTCSRLFMKGEKNCERINVDFCKTYNTTKGRCASCESMGWFFNLDTLYCEKNEAQMCKSLKANSLECQDCETDYLFNFRGQHCVPKTSKTCKTFDSSEDKCADCGPAFMFDGSGRKCRRKSASNCTELKGGEDNECKTCSSLFWLDDGGNCIKRVSKNCKSFVTTNEDKCLDCEDGFQLNAVTGQCNANRGKNCVGFRTDRHGCSSCGSKHYLNDLDECVPNDADNCLKNLEDNPGCQTCTISWFKLDAMCLPKTRKNCSAFGAADTDECASCPNQMKFDAYKNCVMRSAALCNELETGATDECKTCKAGFYKNGNDCARNSALNCLTQSDSANQCDSCSGLFYPVGTNCSLKTKKNCNAFKDDVNECLDCNSSFIINGGTKECDKKTATMCKQYGDSTDTCKNCGPLFYLDAPNCSRDTSTTNCKVYNPNSSGCQECGPEHSKTNCVKNDKTGCLTFKDKANECGTCQPEYHMDGSNNCIKNVASGCKEFTVNSLGCGNCESEFIKVTGDNCRMNDAKNCSAFDAVSDECDNCSSNFVWNGANSKCEANQGENCQTFKTTAGCVTCSPRFYLVGGSGNCLAVDAVGCDLNISQQNKCSTCRSGFYKNGDDCVASSLPNCEQYLAGKNECQICKMGHYAAQVDEKWKCVEVSAPNCQTLKKNKNECDSCVTGVAVLEKASGLECKTYTAENCESFFEKSDACKSCKSDYYMKKIPDAASVCDQRNVIECSKFHVDKDACSECKSDRWMNLNGDCILYTTIEKCITYDKTKNECVACDTGFFKSPTENVCQANPQGIGGCVKYVDASKCSECNTLTYLDIEKNECVPVDKIISQCELYLDALNCSRCKATYLLFENECQKITADNCEEYNGPAACSKCLAGFLPNPETAGCEASGIDHCITPKRLESGVICEKCKAGFFISQHQKSCHPPTKPILGCAEYQDSLDQLRCKNCSDGLAMRESGTECIGVKDLNIAKCERGIFLPKPLCETCYYGYKRDTKGQCVKLENNCALEDNNTKACMLCMPGTNMGADGKCDGTPSDADPEPLPVDTGDGGGGDDGRGSISITTVWHVLVMAWLYLGLRQE